MHCPVQLPNQDLSLQATLSVAKLIDDDVHLTGTTVKMTACCHWAGGHDIPNEEHRYDRQSRVTRYHESQRIHDAVQLKFIAYTGIQPSGLPFQFRATP